MRVTRLVLFYAPGLAARTHWNSRDPSSCRDSNCGQQATDCTDFSDWDHAMS